MKKIAKPQRNCDWMDDRQLLLWIEATSRYLAEAMAEAHERGLLTASPAPTAIPALARTN